MSKKALLLLGMLLLIITVWFQTTDQPTIKRWLVRLNNMSYDMELRAKLLTTYRKPKLKTEIVIVDVDDESLQQEGRWPWPRSKLARLVDRLREAGAVVVVFDMLFPQAEDNIATTVFKKLDEEKLMTTQFETAYQKIQPLFDNDAKFAASLSQMDSIVGMSFLPMLEVEGTLRPPLIKISGAEKSMDFIDANGVIGPNAVINSAVKSEGFINVYPDEDGIIRKVPLLIRYHDGLYGSLALEAVRTYLLSQIQLVTHSYGDKFRLEGIRMGEMTIPTDEDGQVIVPFRGRAFTFPYYSATEVLNNKIDPKHFLGKIVFVGATAIGLGDLKPTSIQASFPGIEINATIADAILKNNFPYRPAWGVGAEVSFTVLLGLVLIFAFSYCGPRILTLCILIIPIVLIFLNEQLNQSTGLVLYVLVPIVFVIVLAMLNMIYGYLFETRKREHLKEMFGQYVPEEHIDEMLKSTGNYGLFGDDREMTVLFADIRNFTTISEPLTAAQLKELLNEFFTPMTEIIFKHRGTIDKYVGDMIMAFWGAPLKDKHHAQHALSAALEMQKALVQLRKTMSEHQGPEIYIGIGLNSGTMSVGDMGSKFRRNYTVLGDSVNLASRVESLTKFYDAKIIATEFTIQAQTKFVFKMLDRVRVKGKKNGVAIYEVLCRKKELLPEQEMELEQYQKALDAYFAQDFLLAKTLFEALIQQFPESKLYPVYLERALQFIASPPPADWDGVYTHTKK